MSESNCARGRGASNFKEWAERIRPEHRALAEQVYGLILEAFGEFEEDRILRAQAATARRGDVAGVVEAVKWGNPCFVYGGAKRCYIADQAKCVHLGFYNGASLKDGSGLVEGTGKAMRHVKLTGEISPETAEVLKGLVAQSAALPPEASAV